MIKTTVLLLINIALWLLLSGHLPVGPDMPALGEILHPYRGLWANGVDKNQDSPGDIKIKGLEGEVKVVYDERGVPHIYAQNTRDAICAMGYVEARDRAFQLEFTSRASSGRLSEVVGPATIEFDRSTLRNGMVHAAEASLQLAQDLPGYTYIEAYTEGINAYIDQLSYADQPIECKLLGFDVEPWQPIKTLNVTAYMSDYLNHYYDDIENTNLVAVLGEEVYNDLYPPSNPLIHPITYGQEIAADALLVPQVGNDRVLDSLPDAYYEEPEEGLGSNAWAVNAALSATGKPLYATDPHLQLSLPSIWYEVQLHTPEFSCHGVKVVGIPGIMMGFNEHMAWGETNVGHDQTDLYQIKWIDKARTRYMLDGKAMDAELKVERIKVKGQADVVDTIRYTYWGPVTYESNDGQHDLAQRWIAHDGAGRDEIRAFVDMMAATGFGDYIAASNHYVGPPQNFNMATRDDTIAIRVNGDLPLRSQGDGLFVEAGDDSRNGWQQLIPREQNPLIVNPPSGYVSSSNQRSADAAYPYYYHGKFSDYRNRAIDTVLGQDKQFTIDDLKALHFDSYSIEAVDILPTMLAAIDTQSAASGEGVLLTELAEWDYRYTAQSVAATVFDEWLSATYRLMWDEMRDLRKRMDIRYPEMYRTIDILKNNPDHPFTDIRQTSAIEDATALIDTAWRQVVNDFADRTYDDLRWGKHRPMTIRHLARVPGMAVDSIMTDGCTTCINANGRIKGPSWRMVVELGEQPQGFGIFPGGQSGNPLSPLYATGVDRWARGEYYELPLYALPADVPATASLTLSK